MLLYPNKQKAGQTEKSTTALGSTKEVMTQRKLQSHPRLEGQTEHIESQLMAAETLTLPG